MINWVTSAAIATILVSTAIFVWQRKVEHGLLLKKEKRELYGRFLAHLQNCIRNPQTNEFYDETYMKLQGLLAEIELIAPIEIIEKSRVVSGSVENLRPLLVKGTFDDQIWASFEKSRSDAVKAMRKDSKNPSFLQSIFPRST